MVGSIALVAALAYTDALRESTASLADIAQEQVVLARALAADIANRLGNLPATEDAALAVALATVRAVERPARLVLMVRPPDGPFRTTDGQSLQAGPVEEAARNALEYARLSREQAAAVGLPARTAMAGLATIATRGSRRWTIAAVATAERQRDRERWARTRLVLSVVIVSAIVMGFGGLAVRHQRKELVAQHELALTRMQQRQEERLSRAARAATLGTLAMGIAHEVSTPLNVILVRAEQLLAERRADDGNEALRVIVQQCQGIGQIIRGLLRLARGDEPQLVQISAGQLIDSAVDLVAHKFATAEVAVQVDRDSEDATVMADPGLLEHALVNLLLNACEASPPGSTVTVRARSSEGGLVLTVDDEGHGISADDAHRAAEPFFTTKAGAGGTGLGLAVAREIVASHRGTLVLSPRSPRGTTALVTVPLAS